MSKQREGEALPQVSVREDRDVQSMLDLEPDSMDPNFVYKFVKDSPIRIARHKMRGYRPVTQDEGVKTLVDCDSTVDGAIRVGDTILMKCPRERVEARQKKLVDLANARLGLPQRKVEENAKRFGVRVIHDKE